jgi:Ca2+-transporting ATPase
LGAAALLSFFLGEFLDGLLVVAFVTINVTLGFVQEYRSERALSYLSSFIVPQALVRRDGTLSRIATNVLVPGDVIMLEPGSMMPADVRIVQDRDLCVDESPLTGESAPVQKIATPLAQEATELFNAHNIGFEGTTVVRGSGMAVIVTTGILRWLQRHTSVLDVEGR